MFRFSIEEVFRWFFLCCYSLKIFNIWVRRFFVNIVKNEFLYEGKVKKIYKIDDENMLYVVYKDFVIVFNGEKKEEISGKGCLNNEILSFIFKYFYVKGINNYFIECILEIEQFIKKVMIVLFEVVVRNVVVGSMFKCFGILEGIEFEQLIIEFYYKDDVLGDLFIIEDYIWFLKVVIFEQVEIIKFIIKIVNEEF